MVHREKCLSNVTASAVLSKFSTYFLRNSGRTFSYQMLALYGVFVQGIRPLTDCYYKNLLGLQLLYVVFAIYFLYWFCFNLLHFHVKYI